MATRRGFRKGLAAEGNNLRKYCLTSERRGSILASFQGGGRETRGHRERKGRGEFLKGWVGDCVSESVSCASNEKPRSLQIHPRWVPSGRGLKQGRRTPIGGKKAVRHKKNQIRFA